MANDESWYQGVLDLFDQASDTASDKVVEVYNRGVGYVKGRWDAMLDDWIVQKPEVKGYDPNAIQATPLFRIMEVVSGINSHEAAARSADAKRAIGNLQVVSKALQDLGSEAAGEPTMLTGDAVSLLADAGVVPAFVGEGGYSVRSDFAQRKIKERLDEEKRQTLEYQKADQVQTATGVISALDAISPLLVVGAALKPKYTRSLMGIHLVSDALTGVLNFRGPNRDLGLSFVDTVKPYATMLSLGVANQVAGGLYR
jgi:hypothetical protein